jgi:hypothetical protein
VGIPIGARATRGSKWTRAAVGDALHLGFDGGREVRSEDLVKAVLARVPPTMTMREQVE